MKITIIGAGIGGLTAAIALNQKGFEVEVFEAFSEFKPLGSGINLASNATQVYNKLGIYEQILKKGNPVYSMNVMDTNLNILSGVDLLPFGEKYGVNNVTIHRSELQKILLAHLPEGTVKLGKKLKSLNQNSEGVELLFEDGTKHAAALVIGADGIHSAVRKAVFGESELRSAKQICWRGITGFELPEKYRHGLFEPWGRGKRFGFVKIGEGKVYWYALQDESQNGNIDSLEQLFETFHPLVKKIIASTPKDRILENSMFDLKPISNWYKGRVCLLGDAAHATTPNLGQGACQAIESAYVLATLLNQIDDYKTAFTQFESIRKKKALMVVRSSWQIGKMAHWSNPVLVGLRNFLMKNTPKSIGQKQSAFLFELSMGS